MQKVPSKDPNDNGKCSDKRKFEPPLGSVLVGTTGDSNAAWLVYRACYWSDKRHAKFAGEFWIAKTRRQWAEETGLSEDQVKRALVRLRRMGLIRTRQAGFGRDRRNYFRFTDDLVGAIIGACPSQLKRFMRYYVVQNRPNDRADSHHHSGEYAPPCGAESHHHAVQNRTTLTKEINKKEEQRRIDKCASANADSGALSPSFHPLIEEEENLEEDFEEPSSEDFPDWMRLGYSSEAEFEEFMANRPLPEKVSDRAYELVRDTSDKIYDTDGKLEALMPYWLGMLGEMLPEDEDIGEFEVGGGGTAAETLRGLAQCFRESKAERRQEEEASIAGAGSCPIVGGNWFSA